MQPFLLFKNLFSNIYHTWKWKLQSYPTLRPHGLYSSWNSPGQNTGVGNFSLLQGNFPSQGSNPGLPHCRQILYQLSHKGSPKILEWVAYPFSRGSSQTRSWTWVSCIAGGFFTIWATRETHSGILLSHKKERNWVIYSDVDEPRVCHTE